MSTIRGKQGAITRKRGAIRGKKSATTREEMLWMILWKREQADRKRENEQRKRIQAARVKVAADKD